MIQYLRSSIHVSSRHSASDLSHHPHDYSVARAPWILLDFRPVIHAAGLVHGAPGLTERVLALGGPVRAKMPMELTARRLLFFEQVFRVSSVSAVTFYRQAAGEGRDVHSGPSITSEASNDHLRQ